MRYLTERLEFFGSIAANDLAAYLRSDALFRSILWSAAFLACLSVLIMLLMTVRKALSVRVRSRINTRSMYLRQAIFRCVDDTGYCDELERELVQGDRALIISIIRGLMDSIRGDTRDRLVVILKRFGAIERHVHNLENGAWGDRVLAALDLAWYDPKDVAAPLLKALDDPSSRVHITAANSLVTLGIPLDVKSVCRKFTQVGKRQPRTLRTFMRRIAPNSVGEFLELLGDDNEDLSVLVLDALGKSQDYSIIDRVSELAKRHASKEVRAAAFRSLAALRHPAASDAITSGLNDVAWEVRTEAANAAGKIGLRETEDRLSELLSDTHWWVRFRSAQALIALAPTGLERLRAASRKHGLAAEISTQVLLEHAGEAA